MVYYVVNRRIKNYNDGYTRAYALELTPQEAWKKSIIYRELEDIKQLTGLKRFVKKYRENKLEREYKSIYGSLNVIKVPVYNLSKTREGMIVRNAETLEHKLVA